MSAEQFISELMKQHNVTGTKETPMPPGANPTKIDDPIDPALISKMRSVNGSLTHLANTCRVDIAHPASLYGQVAHKVNARQYKLAGHTLQYLNGSRSKGLVFTEQPPSTRNKLECYADASYGDNAGFKSQSGYLVMMNGAPISWSSSTQKIISTSSQESEILAAVLAVKECAFLKALLDSWHCDAWPCAVSYPITIHEDNEGTIRWFENGLMSNRAKHYGTRLYYIRDQITQTQLVRFKKISTEHQIADMLTKSLARSAQARHTDKLVRPLLLNHITATVADMPPPPLSLYNKLIK